MLALMLAGSSVFRAKLPWVLRVGGFLESPLVMLRTLQSGHPGDNVPRITVGTAALGLLCMELLRYIDVPGRETSREAMRTY
jgi:hypothetical protein